MTQLSADSPPPYDKIPKHKNIILFGETGAGKSAVINLIAGAEVARTSPDMKACTLLQATPFTITLSYPHHDLSVNIWDTIGLEEPGKDPLQGIENAHQLITKLHAAGGVDLLLFCIRAGRITVAMQRHYRLFYEFLGGKRVPLAIVVTHLETEDVMEDWWARNQPTLLDYGMCSVAHACITAVPARLAIFASKRAESQRILKNMLCKTLSEARAAYTQEPWYWFLHVMEMVVEFLTWGLFKKKALIKRLETRCGFRTEDAQRVAELMLATKKG